MCFKKKEPEKEIPPYQVIKSSGVAFTADQIVMLTCAGLCVEYRADSLKLYAVHPYWEGPATREYRLKFFSEK